MPALRSRRLLKVICLLALAAMLASTIALRLNLHLPSNASLCAWHDAPLAREEQQAASQVWNDNVKLQTGIVRPSPAYAGLWLRDSFWTLLAIGNVKASEQALDRFAGFQLPSGQVPTQFETRVANPLYYDDESTLLFLIWADWQKMQQGETPSRQVLSQALSYVRHVAHGGMYRSSPGTYQSWLDSYRLVQPDTLAYNQGLFVVALLAAHDLGLSVSDGEIAAARAGYRSLAITPGGYLAFSANLLYHDVSGLAGEFLAIWLFHQPLLSDAVVRSTLASQPRFQSGYRVVTDAGGSYLPPGDFIGTVREGDYQDGGSWLLFDYLALATGFLHHVPGTGTQLHDRLAQEFAIQPTFHEYLGTNPQRGSYGTEPSYRNEFSWDTFVIAVDRVVRNACGG